MKTMKPAPTKMKGGKKKKVVEDSTVKNESGRAVDDEQEYRLGNYILAENFPWLN